MNIKKNLTILAAFFLLIITACQQEKEATVKLSPVMVVSVSSNGKYALSSHQRNEIVLWDIEQHSRRIISTKGNIYSAYFISNKHIFMWQGLDDVVHIQKIDGEDVESFKHLSTYGHVITSDLKHYFSSDIDWSIYHGFSNDIKPVKQDGYSPSFRGSGKLLNLSLSNDNRYLLSAGDGFDASDNKAIAASPPIKQDAHYSDYAGVALWDVATLKPIAKLAGNSAKTNATISPDGTYVVSGCENAKGRVWDTRKLEAQPMRLSSVAYGVWLGEGQWDDSEVIPIPGDFDKAHHGPYMAMKFIDGSSKYLGFLTSEPYALLYDIESPFQKKWLPLGRDPFPSVTAYTRNAAIDTAPAANILVTGQAKNGGINVYKYHPDKQELERIWVAE